MKYKLSLLMALLLCFSSCSDDGENEPEPTIVPEEEAPVSISLSKTEIMLEAGESDTLQAEVSDGALPVEWSVTDDRIATVDVNGIVTAKVPGATTVTARAGKAKATCVVKISRGMKIGDYYLSDGTTSTTIPAGTSVVGVVFWLGDPTASDAALKADHPDCTHGLAVTAFYDKTPCAWQLNYSYYGNYLSAWIEENAPQYEIIKSFYGEDDRRNKISGYNNTKAMEAFNASDDSFIWPITVIEKLQEFRASHPAPATSSGWFVPSPKELTLLLNCDTDKDVLDFNDVPELVEKRMTNAKLINERLATIYDSTPIGDAMWDYDFWTSMEYYASMAYHVSSMSGMVMSGSKDNNSNQVLISVLAF